jgi:4-hydroxy-tetrahydrodipicolinate reductase
MTIRLAIAGAAGRMGRVLAGLVHNNPDCVLAGGIEAAGSLHLGTDLGALIGAGDLGVKISADAEAVVKTVDGVIDFTVPRATLSLVKLTAAYGKSHIIGTTGIDMAGDSEIAEASTRTCIVKTGNFSLGVNLLAGLVRQAARALGEDFDIEVLEMHHRMKIDAPSGTALMLGHAAAEGRDISLKEKSVRARDGETGPRNTGDIGFATLRGGTVVGDHTVIFAGAGERLELRHVAENRELFARGAVRAAVWTEDQKPGLYSMQHVLGLSS